MRTHLQTPDLFALLGYVAVLAATGWWFSRRKQANASDYFLAGRAMPAWAVAVSTAATAISAATFVGVPDSAYSGDLTYLATSIGSILAILVVAFVFIPAFYRANVTTVYGLLEQRLGPGARTAAAIAFLVGRVFASGARVYIAAIPAAMIIWHDDPASSDAAHLLVSIVALTIVGIAYTLIGGVRSVIWTDLAQTAVFVGAAGSVLVMLFLRFDASPVEIWNALGDASTRSGTTKATVFSTSTDPSIPYTLWGAVIGMTLLHLAAYGTDHDMAQRMLTCRTPAAGGGSAIAAVLMQVPMVAMFLAIGSLLWVYHHRPELVLPAYRSTTEAPAGGKVFIAFITTNGPAGLAGVTIAGLYAAALSTMNSGLNAMGASMYADVYVPLRRRFRPESSGNGMGEVRVGRAFVVLAGCLVGGFACFCVWWQARRASTLIDLALGVMTFAYAGLLAVFLAAILTRRGNSRSAVASILTGFAVVAALQPGVIALWVPEGSALTDVRLAFPWQLTIGVAVSFIVCICGRRKMVVPSP